MEQIILKTTRATTKIQPPGVGRRKRDYETPVGTGYHLYHAPGMLTQGWAGLFG